MKQVLENKIIHIENHPFIQKAFNNELTNEQLIRWIMCAGRESQFFPIILENMMKWVKHNSIKKILQENLDDEYGNGNPDEVHFVHYLQLLEKLGFSKKDFSNYDNKEGVDLALSLAKNISLSKNIGLALGYMIFSEGTTPVIYSAIKQISQKYYPHLSTTFFDIHIEVDKHHVEQLFRAVDLLTVDEKNELEEGMNLGERGMLVLLDEALGVFEYSPKLIDVNESAENVLSYMDKSIKQ